MKKGATRATIPVANDPQTHAASSIVRKYAKTCRKTCKRVRFCRRRHVLLQRRFRSAWTPQSSKEAGLDRALCYATALSPHVPIRVKPASEDIPSFATGRNHWASFPMREFVSFNTECRPGTVERALLGEKKKRSRWLGDHPEVRGCRDFWA